MSERKFVHVRRCHLCNEVSERESIHVDRCDHCGKVLAPYYFFDEDSVRVYSDGERRLDGEKCLARPVEASDDGTRQPLRGFSTIW